MVATATVAATLLLSFGVLTQAQVRWRWLVGGVECMVQRGQRSYSVCEAPHNSWRALGTVAPSGCGTLS